MRHSGTAAPLRCGPVRRGAGEIQQLPRADYRHVCRDYHLRVGMPKAVGADDAAAGKDGELRFGTCMSLSKRCVVSSVFLAKHPCHWGGFSTRPTRSVPE